MNRLHGSRGAATPSEQKANLRAALRGVRRRLSRDDPRAAEALAEHGVERLLAVCPAPATVAGYHPQGAEIDPGPLLARLAAAGWRAALPRAVDPALPLEFHDAAAPRTPDLFGIPAPDGNAPGLTPDLVLVPVLGFDDFGGRLGQGAGCYDRTLAALRAAGSVFSVGLAFAGQKVDHVPTDEHDVALDLILTERGPVEVVRSGP